jgi:tetratricopeptide (TPR) repeat protein
MPDSVRDEITAAFGDQGVVGVSTAAAPAPGPAPAYALGGTIRRDGDQIRVITRLTNERSGAALWSSSSNYGVDQLSRVPRRIAVDAALMARCGLFAASTYRKPLPDSVMADYMQYCLTAAVFQTAPDKALDSARKVVAAAPDFAWGWSAVADSAAQSLHANEPGARREEVRQIGLQAADRGISLDSRNSAAFAQKSMLIDANDRIGQEKLLKQAIAARPLDCGCEHYLYGIMLQNVGRYADAVPELRRATDMLALDSNSQFALGDSLNIIGKPDEAKPHFDAAVDLDPQPDAADYIAITEATETGNYAAGIKALSGSRLQMAAATKSALLAGYQAMASGHGQAKAQAINGLLALPDGQKNYLVIRTVAVLGAPHEALDLFIQRIDSRWDWPSLLWYPSMRGTLSDPRLPALTQRLGLMKYWRATHTRPDACSANGPPPFCKMI